MVEKGNKVSFQPELITSFEIESSPFFGDVDLQDVRILSTVEVFAVELVDHRHGLLEPLGLPVR